MYERNARFLRNGLFLLSNHSDNRRRCERRHKVKADEDYTSSLSEGPYEHEQYEKHSDTHFAVILVRYTYVQSKSQKISRGKHDDSRTTQINNSITLLTNVRFDCTEEEGSALAVTPRWQVNYRLLMSNMRRTICYSPGGRSSHHALRMPMAAPIEVHSADLEASTWPGAVVWKAHIKWFPKSLVTTPWHMSSQSTHRWLSITNGWEMLPMLRWTCSIYSCRAIKETKSISANWSGAFFMNGCRGAVDRKRSRVINWPEPMASVAVITSADRQSLFIVNGNHGV